MGGDIHQHMKTPGRKFPERTLHQEPHKEKHEKKHDEAVGDIVKMLHVVRDRRFRWCAMTEIWCFGDTQECCHPKDAEREQIRSQTDHEGKPKARSAIPTKRN